MEVRLVHPPRKLSGNTSARWKGDKSRVVSPEHSDKNPMGNRFTLDSGVRSISFKPLHPRMKFASSATTFSRGVKSIDSSPEHPLRKSELIVVTLREKIGRRHGVVVVVEVVVSFSTIRVGKMIELRLVLLKKSPVGSGFLRHLPSGDMST